MQKLIVFILIGFFTQLLDGSLGMSAGLSATSVLLSMGLAPAAASVSIHMAELATTAVSGVSHLKFGNIDKPLFKRLIAPGCIGAFVGACLLSYLPGEIIKPYIAGALLLVGFYILVIYVFGKKSLRIGQGRRGRKEKPLKKSFLYPLALSAGFLDAIGGGGWGPVNTPVLISRTRMKPKKVIGSVDASEFAVALSVTLGFVVGLGLNDVNWEWAASLAIGGMLAAPIAAWVVKVLPSYILGVLVGGVIIFASMRTVLNSSGIIPLSFHDAVYASFITLWFCCGVYVTRNYKKQDHSGQETN
ncbi:sulfite exporter TauE/SafE family protein [Virgibacillus siamensis]|uniref:sulfite exporter TauE/SafE family protein n=1 Tax=Virgibacillus siamensis TaxID=480071 RepID=UPI000987B81B|nr:sulfite exporter TauE/SafE family protein [Virgibacillus siamensis]